MSQPYPATLVRILQVLKHHDVVAIYNHASLRKLEGFGLVESAVLYRTDGRVSRSKRWILTEAGHSRVNQIS